MRRYGCRVLGLEGQVEGMDASKFVARQLQWVRNLARTAQERCRALVSGIAYRGSLDWGSATHFWQTHPCHGNLYRWLHRDSMHTAIFRLTFEAPITGLRDPCSQNALLRPLIA